VLSLGDLSFRTITIFFRSRTVAVTKKEDAVVYRPNVDNQRCFVLLPLRSPFLGYFEKIIKPAALEAGLTAIKADEIYGTRAVISDIWELIWTSRLAVAIVTDQNPNVNYELGMCHALGVPTILVTEKSDDVPFDYRHRRYVRYTPREAGWEQKLLEDLRNTIRTVLSSPSMDEELSWPYDTFDLSAQRKTGRLVPATDSLDSIVRGTQVVLHSIAPAFGPQGGLVSVMLPPHETQTSFRRGYKILQGIKAEDALEEQGIAQMRQLAGEIFSSVGDATKTGLLLSCSMIEEGARALRNGCVPKFLVAGMQKAIDVAVTHIVTEAKGVDSQHLQAIAQTAAGSDAAVAAVVVEALKRVGTDGVVEVVDGGGTEAGLEIQEGMQFDQGFISQSFITDTERQECILEDCYLLLYEGQVRSMVALLPILEQIAHAGKPILVIAGDLVQEALATLILNKEKGSLSCAAVKAPGQGDRRAALLQDMAVLTGGRAFLQERMRPLEDAILADLGRAKKVIVTRGNTTIIEGAGNPSDVASRVHSLRRQIETTLSVYDNAKLRERLAKLGGAIGVIKSGGRTDVDRIDSRYRLESALFSCQSAVENGYVIGGGVCYYRAKRLVERLVAANESEQRGIAAVSHALELPLRQLIQNSSGHNKAKLLSDAVDADPDSTGFNAETEKIANLAEAGVLDSAKALKEALVLAFAHAKGILTTGAWDAAPRVTPERREQ
jgi:chaperonin GroEL